MEPFAQLSSRARPSRAVLISVVLHSAGLLLLVPFVRVPLVRVTQMPGTAKGDVLLTYYSPGSVQPQTGGEPPRPLRPSKAPTLTMPLVKQAEPKPSAATPATVGVGSSAESGLGQGDLRIALPTFRPPPNPDLSSLRVGSAGDVVLDAVIDESGHITQLTVLQSLGPAIDQSVIATVQQWVFTPATLDGKPVPSGQELHFHYRRGEGASAG